MIKYLWRRIMIYWYTSIMLITLKYIDCGHVNNVFNSGTHFIVRMRFHWFKNSRSESILRRHFLNSKEEQESGRKNPSLGEERILFIIKWKLLSWTTGFWSNDTNEYYYPQLVSMTFTKHTPTPFSFSKSWRKFADRSW